MESAGSVEKLRNNADVAGAAFNVYLAVLLFSLVYNLTSFAQSSGNRTSSGSSWSSPYAAY